jgi:hypothetical protein
MLDKYLPILVIITTLIAFVVIVVKNWRWLPVILLPILWFIPRQTIPNGVLEKFVILRWLTVLIIPLIVFIQFIIMAVKSQTVKPTKILLPLAIFVLIYILSGIVNEVKPIELLGSVLLYCRYPLLFIAFVNMRIQEDVFEVFKKMFLTLTVLQIPECVFRFLFLRIHGDFISWSLGPWGAFDLGVYSIYAILFVLAWGIVKGFRPIYILFIISLFILSLIGEIKAFLVSIPVISIVTLYAGGVERKIQKRLMMIVVPLFLILLMFLTYQIWGSVHTASGNTLFTYLGKIMDIIKNPTLLFVQSENLQLSNSRIFGSAFIWNYIKNDWRMILLGAGPGSLLAGNLLGTPGKMIDIPQYLNQITIILGEVGVLGLSVYYIMMITLLRSLIIIKIPKDDLKGIAYRAAWMGMWVYYALLGPFYDLVWRHDSPNFIFYVVAAYIFNYSEKNNSVSVQNE